jgi:Cd2+/Zn2+-exporting ATPase/Cu+-exporting ATPase
MTVGLIAAIVVNQWPAAVLLVFFMRISNYVEGFTTDRVRRSVKELISISPQQASVERAGTEALIPVEEVRVGDIVIVRPGGQIPVDGEVLSGQATVDQANITGESVPLEVGPGARVFAATVCHLGMIRVRAARVGGDTTFGRIVKLVEEAEAHRAQVQRYADKISGYYLPVVAIISILTFVIGGNTMAAAAVLVVACSCVFAIATPIAMMASIGASARKGLLIKGGKYLESLACADVLLLDKTGTLTMGHPQITDVIRLSDMPEETLLQLAATVERYSEHPLAQAVCARAIEHGLEAGKPELFEAIPGVGARGTVGGKVVFVCSAGPFRPNSRLWMPCAAWKLKARPPFS